MNGGARVSSIDAVREFRAALVAFAHEAREALSSHELELRRSLQWLLEEQPQHWQQEIRRSDDAVTQARIELERRLNSRLPGGETPSCMEERKALARARARHDRAMEKAAAMRKWGSLADREVDEYAGLARRLCDLLDADVPKAISTLDRILDSLAAYVALSRDPSIGSAARPMSAVSAGDVDAAPRAPASDGERSLPDRTSKR
jgi:hypothetical protein